jgi:hypothetical protein
VVVCAIDCIAAEKVSSSWVAVDSARHVGGDAGVERKMVDSSQQQLLGLPEVLFLVRESELNEHVE